MKKIASMNKSEVLETLNKLSKLQSKLLTKLADNSWRQDPNPSNEKSYSPDESKAYDALERSFHQKINDMFKVPGKLPQALNNLKKICTVMGVKQPAPNVNQLPVIQQFINTTFARYDGERYGYIKRICDPLKANLTKVLARSDLFTV